MYLRLDADTIVYGAAFAAQKSVDGVITEVEPEWKAISNAKSTVHRILQKLQPMDYKLYFTASGDTTNYRFHYGRNYGYKYLGYKAHRAFVPKPVHYTAVRTYLMENYPADLAIGEEADDRMSITHLTEGVPSIISSLDKDLNMIPGEHYNYKKDQRYIITEEEGIRNFYKQLLEGDRADNIPGIKGLGPVKADKLLRHLVTERDMFETVRDIYKDDERLFNIGICLWMRRYHGQMWRFPI